MNESNYFMLGIVAGIALCMMIGLAYIRIMWDVAKSCYAYGETSAYRKSGGLPPQHTDGPNTEPELDIEAMMNNYVGNGDVEAFEDYDDEDGDVRVNIGGGVRRPSHTD